MKCGFSLLLPRQLTSTLCASNQVKTGREYWEGQSCQLTLMIREEVERRKSIRKHMFFSKQNLQDLTMN